MNIELIEDPSTELVPAAERAAMALESSKTEQNLRTLATKHASITQVVDRAGREQAHGAAMELTRARTAVERTAKEARDDATKFSKAVIAEEKRLIAIVEPEELRLKSVRDAWDTEQARIKREAEEKERARVLAITNRISEINGFYVLALQCRTAALVKTQIDKLAAYDMTGFAEFEDEATRTHADTMKAMGDRLADLTERETEAARVKAEREELERQQAEAKRKADELAAAQKAEADKLAAERAAFARQQAEAAAALRAQQAEVERQRAEFAAQQEEAARKVREAAEAMELARWQAEQASLACAEREAVPAEPAAPTEQAPEPEVFTGPDLVDTATNPVESDPAAPFPPSAQELVNAVGAFFFVDSETAAQWLALRADEFKAIAAS